MKHVLLILCLSSSLGLSQTWDTVGPYGGWINDLTTDAAGNIYAATYVGGVFKTTNQGTTWIQIYNDTLIVDPRAIGVNSSGHIFIATSVQGFFRSTNGGVSWTNINNSLSTRNVRSLLVLSNSTILAGCFPGGVYQSTNNGTTFTTINNALTTTDIVSLAEKTANSYLFVATYGGGIFRSTNAGVSWSPINNGLPPSAQMTWVGVSPLGDIYASHGFSLYRSTNNGDSWSNVTTPATAYAEIAFAPNAMYAATNTVTQHGVHKSTDGGTTWVPETGLPNIDFLNIIASGTTIIAGSAGLGPYRSNGTSSPSDTWTQVVSGMTNTHIVAIDEGPNGNLYAASQFAGVWRSTNDGLTWFSASNGIPPSEQLLGLAVSPMTGTVFVSAIGLNARGYRSTDQGATWTGVSSLYACTEVECNAQGYVFAAYNSSAVRRSTNDGVTWTTSSPSPAPSNIADLAFDRDTVYMATGVGSGFGTSRGVYRSTDNGITWAQENTGLTDLNVVSITVAESLGTSGNKGSGGFSCFRVACATYNGGISYYTPSANVSALGWTYAYTFANQTVRIVQTLDRLISETRRLLGDGRAVDCNAAQEIPRLRSELRSLEALREGFVLLLGTYGNGVERGTLGPVSVAEHYELPWEVALEQNYPNPFNPTTVFSFQVPVSSLVSLKVYDILGREVATLVNGEKEPGRHEVTWNAEGVASGVYLYQLTAGPFTEAKKLILLR